jgi:hypothetical protein
LEVVSSGALGEAEADEEEEDECEESGALEDDDVVDVFVVVVESVDVEVDAEVDTGSGDDEPESFAGPRAFRTSLIKPSLAYACVASHIITPPKLSNFFVYSITSANLDAGIYPVLAAEVNAGTPTMTLTSLFFDTVLAQLSHSSKLYLLLEASVLKLLTPQKLL